MALWWFTWAAPNRAIYAKNKQVRLADTAIFAGRLQNGKTGGAPLCAGGSWQRALTRECGWGAGAAIFARSVPPARPPTPSPSPPVARTRLRCLLRRAPGSPPTRLFPPHAALLHEPFNTPPPFPPHPPPFPPRAQDIAAAQAKQRAEFEKWFAAQPYDSDPVWKGAAEAEADAAAAEEEAPAAAAEE